MTITGSRIEEARKRKNLSQTELARKVGVARTSVAMWESGEKEPSTRHLRELAVALGESSDYLLGIDNGRTISIKDLTDEDVELLHHTIEYMRGRGNTNDG